ncbi:cytochrome c oxidase accessory protein CcoG [Bermanella marisrubri]|uniref:Polyferredoxin n=1 Tax=Bermanella marisrubri TaxID=207949 RepID=Q1N682_9GAMM|nr:cytochrome c oxidase accessory protein CcoG [Bermanella marisrubri]EAT13710.1 Polyferredoxin [Oceanobacter sp. RED65] [Bermanella marisrubri]QIZ84486.1 cytochrome c oxidase accessory protein CcoG [Bermanella marisrubri]
MSEKIPVQELTPHSIDGQYKGVSAKYNDKLYVRSVNGLFNKIRTLSLWALMIGYFVTPWISIGGRQAVWFDLPARQFHIWGMTFWPQDFVLLSFLLIICAFGLFTITTLAGRIWCGYTCPQTAWTFIYMWVEEKIEGNRNKRMKLDKEPMSTSKFVKKASKHFIWLVIALATAIAFVGYFYPIRELIPDLITFSIENQWASFWLLFFTLATYGNAGWLREKVCLHMCPYARFQSVMFDQDTLIVSYDERRGERGSGRGPRKKGVDPVEANIGDCVDCNMCVQVCPTGIDIRDGLQYQCIGCALCIDACDEIMDKMHYPKGLIRYTNEHALEGKEVHIFRPKLVGYAIALVAMFGLFGWAVYDRTPLELDVMRDRGQLYSNTSDGRVQNSYNAKVMNMDQKAHDFVITVVGLEGAELDGKTELSLDEGEVGDVPLSIKAVPWDLEKSRTDIRFIVTRDDGLSVEQESRFIGPASR